MNTFRGFRRILPLVLAGAACSDTEPVQPTQGTSILLADAPFPYDVVSRVALHIVDVQVGADTGTGRSPCGNAVPVLAPNRTFELLALQGGSTATLGEADLPAGQYQAACLTIDTELCEREGVSRFSGESRVRG